MKISHDFFKLNITNNKLTTNPNKNLKSDYGQSLLNTSNAYYNGLAIKNQRSNVSFGMNEDIFAKSRNGHPLIDTFNKNTNSLDIRSNGLYPANVISNLAHNEFIFDGVKCSSLEGFLQSLKTSDFEKQIEICGSYGGTAKKTSRKLEEWKTTQTVFWKGKKYNRNSPEYKQLLLAAYQACYEQNEIYRTALNSTLGKNLTHLSGKTEKEDTILSASEFVEILNIIRGT